MVATRPRRMWQFGAAVLLGALWPRAVRAQPGGGKGSGSGVSQATGCQPTTGTTCANDGTTSWSDTSGLSYSNGRFTGTLKANQCPPSGNGESLSSTCVSYDFTAPGSFPTAASLRGPVGYTFALNYIYGPMDAGFGSSTTNAPLCSLIPATGNFPDVCTVADKACCPPGTTAAGCEDKIRYECETNGGSVRENMFLDECGFHTPDNYHAHAPPRCIYDQANPSGHSPVAAIALDGYGMYGIWEDTNVMPDVDACGGHTGPVPANTALGIPAATVYHYHFTPYPPFTIGCFGPVASVQACKDLYTECSGSQVTFTARYRGGGDYQETVILDCPCYDALNTQQKDFALTKLTPHYMDKTAAVDGNGYNTMGGHTAANGYQTSGTQPPGTTTTATTGTTGPTTTTTTGTMGPTTTTTTGTTGTMTTTTMGTTATPVGGGSTVTTTTLQGTAGSPRVSTLSVLVAGASVTMLAVAAAAGAQ